MVIASARLRAQVSSPPAQAVTQAPFRAVPWSTAASSQNALTSYTTGVSGSAAHAQRGNGIQDRGVGMQDMGPHALDDLLDAVGDFAHQLDFRQPRHAFKQPARRSVR